MKEIEPYVPGLLLRLSDAIVTRIGRVVTFFMETRDPGGNYREIDDVGYERSR
jgi:hypothetical protein